MVNLYLVPGGNDGPSGVLVCSENYLTYKNFGEQQDIRCPIPRRKVNTQQPFEELISVELFCESLRSVIVSTLPKLPVNRL